MPETPIAILSFFELSKALPTACLSTNNSSVKNFLNFICFMFDQSFLSSFVGKYSSATASFFILRQIEKMESTIFSIKSVFSTDVCQLRSCKYDVGSRGIFCQKCQECKNGKEGKDCLECKECKKCRLSRMPTLPGLPRLTTMQRMPRMARLPRLPRFPRLLRFPRLK